ncbi:MAG TPA: hypothetical protein P5250_07410, partial [Bacteroidales bacterium]|nr:hypothetical protein [Bacteroidales bacterium]
MKIPKSLIIILLLMLIGYFVSIASLINNHKIKEKNFYPIDFNKQWQKIDSLVNKGLPKSALEIVNLIYDSARAEHNYPQYIKAIIYKINLKSEFEENYLQNYVNELNNEIEITTDPAAKSILHSLLADIYWKYYNNNRYYLLKKTEISNFQQNDDINTWDSKKIIEKTIYHYLQSLKNNNDLQNIKVDIYDPIIIKDSTTRKFRPTLYDFLAHRAVDFFMNTELDIITHTYKFELDNQEYFSAPNIFTNIFIQNADSFSLKFYALSLLQNLEKFHLNDTNPDALIDVCLKRLNFVHKNSINDDKDSLYINTLYYLEKKYTSHPYSTMISYQLAFEYYKLGQNYHHITSPEYKNYITKAYQICKKAIEKFPKTDGANNCNALIENIEKKILLFTNETAEPANKPFRVLISYKNVNNIFLRIIKISPEENLKLTNKYSSNELISKYLQITPLKQWEIQMPKDEDFQQHSVEIAMPALPLGFYILLISTDANFSTQNSNIVAYNNIWISNLNYIFRKK